MQVGYSDAEWQNRASIYAFLYGLKSMKADTNRDGQVNASEIQTFVAKFVLRLTEGLQVSRFWWEDLGGDFWVW